jgi:hypothetical protein
MVDLVLELLDQGREHLLFVGEALVRLPQGHGPLPQSLRLRNSSSPASWIAASTVSTTNRDRLMPARSATSSRFARIVSDGT